MSIRVAQDLGTAWYDASVDTCYSKSSGQPSIGTADTTIAVNDQSDIAQQTFNWDDDGVFSGDNHRTWTACQMCVARHIYGHGEVGLNTGGFVTVFTAPVDGVYRPVGSYPIRMDVYMQINGVDVWTGNKVKPHTKSYPHRLSSGDVVTMKRYTFEYVDKVDYGLFCPYVYPAP